LRKLSIKLPFAVKMQAMYRQVKESKYNVQIATNAEKQRKIPVKGSVSACTSKHTERTRQWNGKGSQLAKKEAVQIESSGDDDDSAQYATRYPMVRRQSHTQRVARVMQQNNVPPIQYAGGLPGVPLQSRRERDIVNSNICRVGGIPLSQQATEEQFEPEEEHSQSEEEHFEYEEESEEGIEEQSEEEHIEYGSWHEEQSEEEDDEQDYRDEVRGVRHYSAPWYSGRRQCAPSLPSSPPSKRRRRNERADICQVATPQAPWQRQSIQMVTPVCIYTHGEDGSVAGALSWDMRPFRDPDKHDLNIRVHDGHHPMIVQRMMEHHKFESWISEVKEAIGPPQDLFTNFPHELSISLWCRRGRHRSVAASVMLRFLLEKLYAVEVQVEHLSLKPCGCADCDPSDDSRRLPPAFQKKLLQIWRSQ
jgi:hypothetical protein